MAPQARRSAPSRARAFVTSLVTMVSRSPRSRSARAAFGVAVAVALTLTLGVPPAHALRVATWNILRYQPTALDFATRENNFRTAMAALAPNIDILATQELDHPAGRDSFLINVLNAVQPGQWAASNWLDVGTGEGMAIFYRPDKVTLFNVTSVSAGTRNAMLCGVRLVGYPSSVFFRLYSMHLKAGDPTTTPADSTTRRFDCTTLRNNINLIPVSGSPFLLVGDSNFYGDWEGGLARLTESTNDNDGRVFDPLGLTGTWHNNSSYKNNDTQCPCFGSCLNSDWSGGGMDDRFDLVLGSTNMGDGAGFDLVPGSTVAYGNDGAHFNTDLNGDGFNFAVGYTVATALRDASDHIPVYADLQLPAKVAAASQLDFGRVIVGGTASQNLTVSDAAVVPADELNYSLVAPSGFTAPAGTFTANAGGPGDVRSIGLVASVTGVQTGTLLVNSNAADTASKQVLLSGTVIRHASPSLDSASVVVSTTVDFGDSAIGHFADQDVRVHNQGFDASQAQWSLSGATIVGGNGRFSIAGGFTPALLGGIGTTLTLHFDSFGATLDSTYTATLTLSGADEPLPGGTALPNLTLHLTARPISGVLAVGDAGRALRFEAARPNPLLGGTRFGFELPRAQDVLLEIYDLGGRRVASLVQGEQSAGRHELAWNARDDHGARVAGGLYFARFATPGLTRIDHVVVLP